MKNRAILTILLIQLLFSSIAMAESAPIIKGLNYLATTQNSDGSWMKSDEQVLTTAEAIKTLKILNQADTPNYINAVSWLQSQLLETTSYLSSRIHLLAVGGTDNDVLISYLDVLRKAWGGNGEYSVNNLDTALALQALNTINYSEQTTIQSAISYLLTNQNTDGGWGFEAGEDSNVFMAASVVSTLAQFASIYDLQTPINNGSAYLLGKQNTDGGFGSSPSTAYETGVVMEALIASGVNISSATQPAIDYLTSTQLADGSWDADPYHTSLALRAFAGFKPDPAITSSDITFSKDNPVVGETIDIYANVRNNGSVEAANVTVQFYNGDPASGGTLIGESVIASIAAFGSVKATISWTISTAFAGKVFVVVNPLNTVDELNTNNNEASKNITSATLPDLQISSADISFDPSLPHSGESVTLTANVRNTGETSAANISVDIYNGDPDSGGVPMGSTVISAIGAGSSVAVTASGSFTDGAHAIFVVVDGANTIVESDKTNNKASKTLTIGQEGIDLSVSRNDISFSPASPKEGNQVTINAVIKNMGVNTATNVEVAFYLNDPDNGGTVIGSSVYVPEIAGRGIANVSITWDSTGHSGKNDIYIKIDPQSIILDSERSNNKDYQSIVVLANSGADLSISSGNIHFSSAQPTAGVPVVVSATVYNSGTEDAANVTVEFALGDPRVDGTLIFATQTISSIPQGGSAVAQATFNTTGYAGLYDIYVNVDPFDAIIETSKTNNIAKAEIAIKATSAPDLIVTVIDTTGVTTDSQTLAISGAVIASITNKGNSDTTAPFNMTVFEDTDKNKMFDPAKDTVLGTVTYSSNLTSGASDTVNIPLSGTVLFKDNLLYVMTDSGNVVAELVETNNIMNTGDKCSTTPIIGTFNPVEKWVWTGSTTLPTHNQVMMTPVVARIADTNGDGLINEEDVPIIIFSTFYNSYNVNGVLRAIRGDNGQEVFSISDSSLRVNPTAQIAVGDIDNDGFMEIIVPAADRKILCFEHTGTLKWKSSDSVTGDEMWGGPSIADLDNDGKPEIIMGPIALNNNGTRKWFGWYSSGSAGRGPVSLVADVNLDGLPEVVAGNSLYKNNGTCLWINNSLPDGYNAVANFNDDPYPEIVYVNTRIYLLNRNGQILWGAAIPGGGTGGPPVVADFDGDGYPEIGVAGSTRYVVYKKDGSILWQSVTSDTSSNMSGSSVFDFEGDGKAEVIYNDEHYLRIYNGSDGRKLLEVANSSGTAREYPVIADINNDGHAEIVFAANNYAWGTKYGIRVFGDADNSWVNTRQIWNQYTYHITNVNDDGTIPRIEQNNWDKYNNYRCNVLEGNVLGVPDISVSYISADTTDFPSSANISARIGNGGAIALPAGATVDFYDGDPANGGSLIGTAVTLNDINVGEYEDVSVLWNSPVAGDHSVYVVADQADAIDECSSDNNAANVTLSLNKSEPPTSDLPDLSLSPEDIVIIPPDLVDGQVATISATIHNTGTIGASNVIVSFYDGDPANGGTFINSATVASIDAGGTGITSVIWNTFNQSGMNYIHVIIDSQSLITESNKDNNSSLRAVAVAIPTKPDIAITSSDVTLSNINPKAGEVLVVNAVVHNLGVAASNIEASLYDGNPSTGGTLIAQKTISSIIQTGATVSLSFEVDTMGLSGSHDYYLSLDPDNKIDEVNENNNVVSASAVVSLTNLNLTVSTDKSVYNANEIVQIAANASNLADVSRAETIEIKITDTFGNLVSSVITDQQVSLDASESKTVNATWNTGKTYSGDYKAVALLRESGVVVARAEARFNIANVKNVSSKISTDKVDYIANETVTITNAVQNNSGNIILNNLTARVTLSNTGGTVLYTEDLPIAILALGQSVQLKNYWNTVTNLPGIYNVRLEVFDNADYLSTSTTSFTIVSTNASAQGLQGTVSVTPTPVYQGKDVTLGYSVNNIGNEDISQLNIKILIVDPVTQEVKSEYSDQQPIAKASSIINLNLNNVKTAYLSPGTYLAILQVATTTMTEFKTLAKANFDVKDGLEVSKTVPSIGNLLVWVNMKCKKTKCGGDGHHEDKDCIRIDLLENILKNASVGYLIVYDKKDFQQQLRNSYFTDYMIIGYQHEFEDHYRDELRELVYSGKGLISSVFVTHGQCDTPLLGIKFRGHLSKYENVELIDSPISVAGTLAIEGKTSRAELLADATVAGWFQPYGHDKYWFKEEHHCDHCHTEHNPAIVLNNYGQGKSVYFAFDIGQTLDDNNYDQIASLITNSITYVHKPIDGNGSFLPNQLVPVEVKIKSLGGIFDLKIKETYPSEIKIYDPVTSQWITDNPWMQDMQLESDATNYFNYYALTPDIPATYTLQTEIGYQLNNSFNLYKTANTQITVGSDTISTILPDNIITALNALPVTTKERKTVSRAVKYIERVKNRGNGSLKACEENIHDILKAVEEIMDISSCDISQVRLMMDMLMQINQGKYYFGN